MAVFKCKMCGGTLEINENQTTATCEYCFAQQTLPKLDDARRANLYDRANHFRRNNEFDKAMSIYENILNEDGTDAEAYWSLVLCRYGIEYVEDSATHKRVPTVNRAQFTSIFDDDNYKSALHNADIHQRAIYEAEAKTINEIQKGILAISQKEDPFDVFICYKETDNNGRRTPDSVLANDLYHQLTQEGFKAFFSRITLEDKLGTAYEPYIFAALNSAKVMVVLGTRPEYFNAVWVKNEWSRYLALMKQSGGKKVLIPAYKDMDPYDLPEEFSHLQALDMSKLGFMQDLIRGIKKLTQADAPKAVEKETVVMRNSNASIAPLLKRAFMYLEDGDWKSADEYCERVLDMDPENGQAYLGKMLAKLKVGTIKKLKDCAEPFDNSILYQKIVRFGDQRLQQELADYNSEIRERNETARLVGIYQNACSWMSQKTIPAYQKAAEEFDKISNYKDASEKAEECRRLAITAQNEAQYDAALRAEQENTEHSLREAAERYQKLAGWRDSKERFQMCMKLAEERRVEGVYRTALKHEQSAATEKDSDLAINSYYCAISLYKEITQWNDSAERVEACNRKIEEIKMDKKYLSALMLESDAGSKQLDYAQRVEKLKKAASIYKEIWQWKDSHNRAIECEAAIDALRAQKQAEAEAAEKARLLKEEAVRRKKQEEAEAAERARLLKIKMARKAQRRKIFKIAAPIIAGAIAVIGIYSGITAFRINRAINLIDALPESVYEFQDIADAYDAYQTLTEHEKSFVDNAEKLTAVMNKFNHYIVDKLMVTAQGISVETVNQTSALQDVVALFSALTEEQRNLLAEDDADCFENYVLVAEVINNINAIETDLLQYYDTLNDAIGRYSLIDEHYRELVYNYHLVDTFRNTLEWYDETAKVYNIDNAAALTGLSLLVQSGITFEGKNVNLTADIYLNEYTDWEQWTDKTEGLTDWMPIGAAETPFKGNFNGNGYSVYGMYISSSLDNLGLFGYVENALIQNVSVMFSFVSGESNVAAVCGHAVQSDFSNCHSNANIIGDGVVGGVLGCISRPENAGRLFISGCSSRGSVINTARFGAEDYYYTVSAAGGVVGAVASAVKGDEAIIERCSNYARIEGNSCVGGVIGKLHSYFDQIIVVRDCLNDADVISKDHRTGGIIGYNYQDGSRGSSANSVTIQYCVNYGTIRGENEPLGGVLGFVHICKKITSCTIVGCYNINAANTIRGTHDTRYPDKVQVNNCVSDASVDAEDVLSKLGDNWTIEEETGKLCLKQ